MQYKGQSGEKKTKKPLPLMQHYTVKPKLYPSGETGHAEEHLQVTFHIPICMSAKL